MARSKHEPSRFSSLGTSFRPKTAKDSGKPLRLSISGPVGPVKNSRGPDLVRCDSFQVVSCIEDCSGPGPPAAGPLASPPDYSASNKAAATGAAVAAAAAERESMMQTPTPPYSGTTLPARRLPSTRSYHTVHYEIASDSAVCNVTRVVPMTAHAKPRITILGGSASSSTAALTSSSSAAPYMGSTAPCRSPKTTYIRPSAAYMNSACSPRKPRFRSSEPVECPPREDMAAGNENVPPWTAGFKPVTAVPAPRPPIDKPAAKTTRLPKSRTASVLHDLKASISRSPFPSRSSLASKRSPPAPEPARRQTEPRNRLTALEASTTSLASSFRHPSNSSRLRDADPPLSSLSGVSTPCSPPESPSGRVSAAQPSEYWTGRYMALEDKLRNQAFEAGLHTETPSPPLDDVSSKSSSLRRPRLLSGSMTTPSLSRLRATSYSSFPSSSNKTLRHGFVEPPGHGDEEDPDARARRILAHLDSLCVTADARNSLRDWQQDLARRQNKPQMLPRGGCMSDGGRKRSDGGGGGGRGLGSSLMSRVFGASPHGEPRRPAQHHKSLASLREAAAAVKQGMSGYRRTDG